MNKPTRHPLAMYKPDVSLGNILTMIGMLMAVIVWGLRLEGRVDSQQQLIHAQQSANEIRFSYIEGGLSQQRQDMERALQGIGKSLERIENKLDGKADKAK
jgi:hypothetical protein